jgi:DNA-binding NtrC family response regulator
MNGDCTISNSDRRRETLLNKSHRVLVIDDDEDILTAARLLLKRRVAELVTCSDPGQVSALLAQQSFDVVMLDLNFSPGASDGRQGLQLLADIRAQDSDIVVVVITAHGGTDVAVEAMKYGATDFIAKPWQNEKLLATLSAAVSLHASRQEARQLRQSHGLLAAGEARQIIGQSEAMQRIMQMLSRAAPTDANVLITGENGTGKELIARELHRQSQRADAVFMAVDLGAVSETLFESELFGHRKGAFTGANESRIGRLEAANGGTLFLDEIGNIPLPLQAKLLTVLEQRKVTPLGANKAIALDIRVIAATNLAQNKLEDENCFRQDLLFRLNTVQIPLPALRERSEDIAEIAAHYSAYYAKKYQRPLRGLSQQALQAAQAYHWPGNIRALRHAIERAVIMADGDELQPEDLQLSAAEIPTESQIQSPSLTGKEAGEDLNLERMERRLIEQALNKHNFNISHAADDLGLTRAALYRRMKKHDL